MYLLSDHKVFELDRKKKKKEENGTQMRPTFKILCIYVVALKTQTSSHICSPASVFFVGTLNTLAEYLLEVSRQRDSIESIFW